ncbi:hypothetical protein FE89_31105, partial [Azospirillum brasilense]
KIGGDIHVLVAGQGAQAVAEAASKIAGVAKVLLADDAAYAHPLPENVAPLVVNLAKGYGHVLAAASKAVVRTVTTLIGSADFTVAMALPA